MVQCLDVLAALQDFDTAKRHVGMVLTQYDPDSAAAKEEFRGIKDYQKTVSQLRLVRRAAAFCRK
jgi:hypothetical protein